MRNIEGKLALVTGAGSGIGRATARALAAKGARLVLCDVNETALAEVERELGPRVELARKVDVSKRDEMAAFAEAVHGRVAAVDILVNNAGVGLAGDILCTSLDDWEWVLGVNLWGVVHGCHFFVPRMVARGGTAHVVNVASGLGLFGSPRVIGYATSKFAVVGMSECMRAELAPHRIGVSTICPGFISTNIVATGRMSGAPDVDAMRARLQSFFNRRNFPPEGVARAIVKAIVHNRGLVPVTPEAHVIYWLKRFAPWLVSGRFGHLAARYSLGE